MNQWDGTHSEGILFSPFDVQLYHGELGEAHQHASDNVVKASESDRTIASIFFNPSTFG
jgi:hypothetical protein